MIRDETWPLGGRKRKESDLVPFKMPREVRDQLKLNCHLEGFPTMAAYLRNLAPKLKPTVEDLKRKHLLRDFEESDFEKKMP